MKEVQEQIKQYATAQFRNGDTKVSIDGHRYQWVLSKTTSTELDKERLIADNIYDKYSKEKTVYKLTSSKIKED